MIRLTVVLEDDGAVHVASALYFRITGGAVWIGPGAGAGLPLVKHTSDGWHYGGRLWSGMRFEGRCRVIFGVPADPAGVSDVIDALAIHERRLSANGVPFAHYDADLEMWRGAGANVWWHAFRIEAADFRESLAQTSEPEGKERPVSAERP